MKPFAFKLILPATMLALLPFGVRAGVAQFKLSTAPIIQVANGLEEAHFNTRKVHRKWWQHNGDGGSSSNSNSNSNSSSNSNSNSSSNSSDNDGGND